MKYFKESEFNCRCGCGKGFKDMDPSFLLKLDAIREQANIPFVLNSAVRCEKHNKACGGKPNSAHLRGLAVDIQASNPAARYAIVNAALSQGCKRIGVYKSFIHVDFDTSLPQNVLW